MILECSTIALAAAVVAVTVTKSRLFEAPRRRLHRPPLLRALVRCAYCATHWTTGAGVALYRPRLLHSGAPVLDVVVTGLATLALACVVAGLLSRAYTFSSPTDTLGTQ